MDLQLQGKKAVISGGSRGIGKAVARQLAREGCDVAIFARSEGPLKETAEELARETGRKVVPLVTDTMSVEQINRSVQQAAAALGGIDIVINAAARVGGAAGDIETVDEKEILRDFEEKVVGYIRVARAAVPYMKQAGWGRIINISGGAGRNPGTNLSGGARNSATVNATKAMANALAPHGINVVGIYPGQTVTEATHERNREIAAREGKTIEQVFEEQAQRTLQKRLVTAEDIAHVVTFLCSPLSFSITGEAIAVNGGSSPDVHF
jgi:NAD(P)-dependent dehydrogenase (short-subunit alcohol dehydrogenase family)